MTISTTERTPITDGETDAALICERARKALRAAKDPTVTDDAIATRWYGDDKNASYVGRLLNSNSGANISLGKVLALPKSLARAVLVRCLAHLDEGAPLSPRDTVDHCFTKCAEALGAIRRDLADDGKLNDHAAHEQNFGALAALALRGAATAQRAREAGK